MVCMETLFKIDHNNQIASKTVSTTEKWFNQTTLVLTCESFSVKIDASLDKLSIHEVQYG